MLIIDDLINIICRAMKHYMLQILEGGDILNEINESILYTIAVYFIPSGFSETRICSLLLLLS